METKIFNMNGTENGSITLNDEVFAIVAHPQNINDIVKAEDDEAYIPFGIRYWLANGDSIIYVKKQEDT